MSSYDNNKVIFNITRAQLVEGVSGALGLIFFNILLYYLIYRKISGQQYIKHIAVGISFLLTWYVRRISINYFNNHHHNKNYQLNS